jgi:hypothetical protein
LEEAKVHAEQTGGYVRRVSEGEASEDWLTGEVVGHDDLMWDWVNDDLFEGIAHLEERIEAGKLGLHDIRGELFNLEDMVEEGELDDTDDIRKRIMILGYWYADRFINVLGP